MKMSASQLTAIIQEGAPYDLDQVLDEISDSELLQVIQNQLEYIPLDIFDDILERKANDPSFINSLYNIALGRRDYYHLSRFLPYINEDKVWSDVLPNVDDATFTDILNELPDPYKTLDKFNKLFYLARAYGRPDLANIINDMAGELVPEY